MSWIGAPGVRCPHGHGVVSTDHSNYRCEICGDSWPVTTTTPQAKKPIPIYQTTQGGDPLVSYDGGRVWQSTRPIVGSWTMDVDGVERLTVNVGGKSVTYVKYADGTVRGL